MHKLSPREMEIESIRVKQVTFNFMNMNIENVAQVSHEMNKAYCESIGDMSQLPWSEAPEWQKESAKQGVYLHLTNPLATPEDSHNSWLKQKSDDGWKYGPVKDVEAKEHPCFRPYNELPESQKAKDFLFRQTVHSLAKYVVGVKVSDTVTFGQKAVGLSFNPSNDDTVGTIKQQFADCIDTINDVREGTSTAEVKRMSSTAITYAQTAQMWAVKAITWKD